jgi:hypothetical protein
MTKRLHFLLLALGTLVMGQTPISVASRKQLFVDNRFIESSEGVALKVNHPHQTGEELVVADQQWEQGGYIGPYSTVSREDGPDGPKVRLWYSLNVGEPTAATGFNPPVMVVAYAESRDGIHFNKPILGLVEKDGSKQNNLVFPTDISVLVVGGGSVRRDDNPNTPIAERYKSWSKCYPRNGSGIQGGHRIWSSPDGLDWTLSPTIPTGLRKADTQPNWFWDPRIGKYVGYSREWVQVREGSGGLVRMSSYNESDDMFHWDSMFIALSPDERDLAANPRPVLNQAKWEILNDAFVLKNKPAPESRTFDKQPGTQVLVENADEVPAPGAPVDFYSAGIFPYRGAEDVYFGLVPAFYHWRSERKGTFPDTADVQLAVSRDARHFTRPGGREPFLRLGPGGRFDSQWVWALPEPIQMGDELWIYYVGTNENHSMVVDPAATGRKTAVSRAVMRLDGFMSADAAYEGGILTTPPITFSGSHLELNLDTSAGGVARVEILDEQGQPIPGFTLLDAEELNGNSVRMRVSWRNSQDVSKLAGKSIKLRFELRSCKLYAFQFLP